MRKSITLLAVLLCLVGMAYAQSAQDAPRSSLNPGYYAEPTSGNSQYIYIRVTMAGAVFVVSNGDWQVGDLTAVPTPWYAYPQNTYQSANGTWGGEFPFAFVSGAPYTSNFTNDCPVIWNQGGTALDFFLAMSDAGGFAYESHGSSSRMNPGVTSAGAYVNAFQVRAIFLNTNVGITTTYNDAGYAEFKNPKISPWVLNPSEPRLQNTDVVYTSAMFGGPANVTANYGWTAVNIYPWAEATTFRFNPDGHATHFPASCTNKGLGIPPNAKTTIAMQLITPRSIVGVPYTNYLRTERIFHLRVWGAPSDAN